MAEPTRTVRCNFLALFVCSVCAVSPVRAATLIGTFSPVPTGTDVNLTEEGTLDWVHWGLYTDSSLDRKAGVTPQIPDFTPIKIGGPFQYADNYNGYSWSDGVPTQRATNTPTGVWMYGKASGFELRFATDTTPKTLKLYVGTFGAVGTFTATLSGSSLSYADSSISNDQNGPGGVYTLEVAGDTPGQMLDIKYVVDRTFDSTGNVTLQAATLSAPGANNPPAVSISEPVDGANFSANDNIYITADPADADGSIGRVEFFQGSTKLGESTTSPYSLTWSNAPAGNYLLTARASDDRGGIRTSVPVQICVNGTGGALSGRSMFPAASVDLTAEGSSDWAYWGLNSPASFDHKAGVPLPQQISNFTLIGTNLTQELHDYVTEFSWSDGTPTGRGGPIRTGASVHGSAYGFRITAPADPNGRTLKVYVGLYGAEGRFQAYLSDHSAPAYTDTSLSSIYGDPPAVYILDYRAASSGQTLIVEYTARTLFDVDYGYVSLQAATLSGASLSTNAPPTVVVTSASESATYTTLADITITATASDSDGSISKVEFFEGATRLGEATNVPYSMVWSNVLAGSYSITAKATDDGGAATTSTPVNVTVNSTTTAPVTRLSPLASGNRFSFSFSTESNRTYLVEHTTSLGPVYWQTLTNVVGEGTVITITDSLHAEPQRFYRVKTQ